jgi:NAD(P)-dependent dehydrogenase (short-subunit alcohol dehydrogenase family)
MEFNPDQFSTSKRVAFVTGATGSIGRAIAWQIGGHQHCVVIMLARDPDKARKVLKEIRLRSNNDEIYFHVIDLASKDEIIALSDAYKGPVHILVNNASITPRHRQVNHDGIEMQWATNVLGYYHMMKAFTPHLRAGTPSRIINVASYWAGGLNLDDPEFKYRHYNNDSAYRQSKQAERMLSTAFARQLTPDITVNACHPGDVNSNLSNSLGFGGHESPDQGAATPAWLALDPSLEQQTGGYYEHLRKIPCRFSEHTEAVERLLELCASY